MICPKCNHEISNPSKFCSNCGFKLDIDKVEKVKNTRFKIGKKTLTLSIIFILLIGLFLIGHFSEDSEGQTSSVNTASQNKTSENKADTSDKINQKEFSMQGTIDNNLSIHMKIKFNKGDVTGTYYYDKYSNTSLKLKGTYDKDNNVTMNEVDDKGTITGTFTGNFSDKGEFKGTWSNPDKSKKLSFAIYTSKNNSTATTSDTSDKASSSPSTSNVKSTEIQFSPLGSVNDRLRIYRDGKFGFADSSKNVVVDCKYDFEWDFLDNLAPVLVNGQWGFIDKNGTMIIQPQYKMAWPKYKGYIAVVRQNGSFAFITDDGKSYNAQGDYVGYTSKMIEYLSSIDPKYRDQYMAVWNASMDGIINAYKAMGNAFDAESRRQEYLKDYYSSPISPFRY